jgi:hypothetical protein
MTAEVMTPNDDVAALSDRELMERVANQLDHLDTMLHEQGQLIGELRPLVPLIPRALALLDPGAAMRKHWKRGKPDE